MLELAMGIWEAALVNFLQSDIRFALTECLKRPNIPTLPEFIDLCDISRREREWREKAHKLKLEHKITDAQRARNVLLISQLKESLRMKNPIKDAN